MINIYSDAEIEIMSAGGRILSSALAKTASAAEPGISTYELNAIAEKAIGELGGRPAFLGYAEKGMKSYPASLCASVNDEIVHCLPYKNKILKSGDIIGLDLGVKYEGYYTDMAVSVAVGKISPAARKLLQAVCESLEAAIGIVKPGITIGDLGSVIQKFADQERFGVIRDLVGHGIGKKLHEEPSIPNYGYPGTGAVLKKGMVLALEPMFSEKSPHIRMLSDGWGIATADGGLSAHFEKTVAVTENSCRILTP